MALGMLWLGGRILGVAARVARIVFHPACTLPLSSYLLLKAWLLHRRVRFSTRVRLLRQLDDATLRRLLGDDLPVWVLSGDWERVESLNTAVAALWQPLNDTVFSLLGPILEGALRQSVPAMLRDVRVHSFSLGSVPPLITALRITPALGDSDGDHYIDADVEVVWDALPTITLKLVPAPLLRVKTVGGASTSVSPCVYVKLTQAQATGRLRFRVGRLLPALPLVQQVTMSFLERPFFNVALGAGTHVSGGVELSMVSSLVSAAAAKAVRRLLWPRSVRIVDLSHHTRRRIASGSPSALTAVLTDALAQWEEGEEGLVVGETTPGGVWDAMQATLEQWGVPQPIAVVEVALLDAQLGALDSRVGGPLTFAEHPRPYLVLSGAPPPPPEAASVSSGSSAAGGAAGGDGEHLVGQVWVSGPLGRTPSDAPQRATLVVYKRQQELVLTVANHRYPHDPEYGFLYDSTLAQGTLRLGATLERQAAQHVDVRLEAVGGAAVQAAPPLHAALFRPELPPWRAVRAASHPLHDRAASHPLHEDSPSTPPSGAAFELPLISAQSDRQVAFEDSSDSAFVSAGRGWTDHGPPMLRPRLSASLSECPPSPNVVFSRAAQVGQQLQHDLDNPTALTSLMHDNAGSNDADAASVASSQGSAVGLGLPTKQSARRALTSAFADAQPTAPTPQNQGAAVSVGSPPMGPRGPVGPAESTVTGRCLQSTPSRRLSVAPPDAHRTVSQLYQVAGPPWREAPPPLHPSPSAAAATSYHSQDSEEESVSEAGSEADAAVPGVGKPHRGRIRGVMTWLFDALLADASLEQTNWDQAAAVLLPGEPPAAPPPLVSQQSTLRDMLLSGELEVPDLPPPPDAEEQATAAWHAEGGRNVQVQLRSTPLLTMPPPGGVRGAAVLELAIHRLRVDYTYDDSVPKLIVSCGHSNASALKVQGRSTTLTSQGGTIMHFDVVLHVPVNLPEASEGQQDLHHASSHSDCTPQSSVDQGDGQPKGGGRHRVGQRDGSNHCEERSQRPSLVNGGSGGSGTPRLVGAAEELRIALVAVPDRWKVALLKFWDDPYMHAETQAETVLPLGLLCARVPQAWRGVLPLQGVAEEAEGGPSSRPSLREVVGGALVSCRLLPLG